MKEKEAGEAGRKAGITRTKCQLLTTGLLYAWCVRLKGEINIMKRKKKGSNKNNKIKLSDDNILAMVNTLGRVISIISNWQKNGQ